MYDVMVFDHRLAGHRPLDSKAELTRWAIWWTLGLVGRPVPMSRNWRCDPKSHEWSELPREVRVVRSKG